MTVKLPDRNSVEGAVARVVLIEARGPAHTKTYVEADSKQSMQWMKVVLVNRLNNNPAQFMASGAKSLIDIIKAPGQFAGFENYPIYDQTLADNLQDVIDIANSVKDSRAGVYKQYILNGIDVATHAAIADPAKAADPKSTGIFAWRTGNSGSPGPRFKAFKLLAGNQFYTLGA